MLSGSSFKLLGQICTQLLPRFGVMPRRAENAGCNVRSRLGKKERMVSRVLTELTVAGNSKFESVSLQGRVIDELILAPAIVGSGARVSGLRPTTRHPGRRRCPGRALSR